MEITALHGFGGFGADFDVVRRHAPCDARWRTPDLDYDWDHTVAKARTGGLLLGYSMGARAALHAALSARPAGLILVGATAGLDGPERTRRATEDARMADDIRQMGARAFAEHWSRVPLIATQSRVPEPFGTQLRQRRAAQPVERLIGHLRHFGQGTCPSAWSRLPRLDVDVLLVSGALDAKYEEIGKRMAERLPRATHLVIPGVGHAAHLEAPEAFVAAVAAWWRGLRT